MQITKYDLQVTKVNAEQRSSSNDSGFFDKYTMMLF